uniref:(northern house mosquito) hypothetical protein n=1 Tax=Culex pipiens TaxID=7175 RepID=A0A8D8JA45_CULPI
MSRPWKSEVVSFMVLPERKSGRSTLDSALYLRRRSVDRSDPMLFRPVSYLLLAVPLLEAMKSTALVWFAILSFASLAFAFTDRFSAITMLLSSSLDRCCMW